MEELAYQSGRGNTINSVTAPVNVTVPDNSRKTFIARQTDIVGPKLAMQLTISATTIVAVCLLGIFLAVDNLRLAIITQNNQVEALQEEVVTVKKIVAAERARRADREEMEKIIRSVAHEQAIDDRGYYDSYIRHVEARLAELSRRLEK